MYVHVHVYMFEVTVVGCFIRRASELRKKPHLSLAEKSKDLKKVGTAWHRSASRFGCADLRARSLIWYSMYVRSYSSMPLLPPSPPPPFFLLPSSGRFPVPSLLSFPSPLSLSPSLWKPGQPSRH